MSTYQLDILPVELVHHLLNYFSAHEIFYTFRNSTSYIDAILLNYADYRINFKSISRTNFDLICQHIKPDQVISLTLSDDEMTPGLIKLFLSHFQITQFTRLRSLTLIEIGPDFWKNIVSELIELKHLRSFSVFPSNRTSEWVSNMLDDDETQLDEDLFNSYAPVLPQLDKLRLSHGDFLGSIAFPQLRHLILERSSHNIINHICSVAPQLKSLDTTYLDRVLTRELLNPLLQLNRLNLRIDNTYTSMDDIEQMMANVPELQHLELHASCNKHLVNGERWRMQVKNLVTFNFKLFLLDELVSEDLDSFRTSFWVEEKRWFVAYQCEYLFSIPHFCLTETDESFEPPLYSTMPDNSIFYDCIKRLELFQTTDSFNYQFNHVETVLLSSHSFKPSIERIVSLSRVEYLILHSSMAGFSIKGLINKMSNLRHITIQYDVNKFARKFRGTILDQIQRFEIHTPNADLTDFGIEQLCRMFPKIEQLQVNQICSTIQIFDFLYRFKHLSTASFRYVQRYRYIKDAEACRLEIQSTFDQTEFVQRLNYTCRFDSEAVHFWVSL